MLYVILVEDSEEFSELESILIQFKIETVKLTSSQENFFLYIEKYGKYLVKPILYGTVKDLDFVLSFIRRSGFKSIFYCNPKTLLKSELIEIEEIGLTDIFNLLKENQDGAIKVFNNMILVRKGTKLQRIKIEEILYIQSQGNHIQLFAKDTTYVLRESLKSFSKILPNSFYRVHTSYIINIDHLNAINPAENSVIIENHTIPLGRKYKKSLLEKFKMY